MSDERTVSITIEKMGEFSSRQDKCPHCKSKDIKQSDPPENGINTMECVGCDYHWMEKLS